MTVSSHVNESCPLARVSLAPSRRPSLAPGSRAGDCRDAAHVLYPERGLGPGSRRLNTSPRRALTLTVGLAGIAVGLFLVSHGAGANAALSSLRGEGYGLVLYLLVAASLLLALERLACARRQALRLQRRETALGALQEAVSAVESDLGERATRLVEALRECLSLGAISIDWSPSGDIDAPVRLPVVCNGEVHGWLSASEGEGEGAAGGERAAERNFLLLVARWLGSELERAEAAAALRAETERVRTTLDSIADAVLTTDSGGRVDYANPAALRIMESAPDALIGRGADEVLTLVDRHGRAVHPVEDCRRTGATRRDIDDVELRREQGNTRVACTVAPLPGGHREQCGCVVVLHEVHRAPDASRELRWRANHDAVTGLLNRGGFEHAAQTLLGARRTDDRHVLVLLDIDQFRVINELHGRAAGDRLLHAIGARLRQVTSEDAMLARLDADRFGVLLAGAGADAAHAMVEAARAAFATERLASDDGYFEVTASYGIAPCDGVSTAGEWIAAAEAACDSARALGPDRVALHSAGDQVIARRRGELQWVSRLNEAMEDHRLVLYEQPVVATGEPDAEPSHWEVLLRLVDDTGGIVTPGEFLPVAERYGLITRIDRYVVARALERLARVDLPARRYAVNLSGVSLSDPDLVGYLHELVARHAPPPGALCFEITETAAVSDLDNAVRLIEALRALGCRFALDDFGAGLSSFHYLRRLPVDYLKIDGAFVRDIDEDRVSRGMVEAIHRVGQVMGIRTIGEFVESERICAALAEIGVDYAQGYWTGRPAPVEWHAARERRRANCA